MVAALRPVLWYGARIKGCSDIGNLSMAGKAAAERGLETATGRRPSKVAVEIGDLFELWPGSV